MVSYYLKYSNIWMMEEIVIKIIIKPFALFLTFLVVFLVYLDVIYNEKPMLYYYYIPN